jgi:hypothetical protein
MVESLGLVMMSFYSFSTGKTALGNELAGAGLGDVVLACGVVGLSAVFALSTASKYIRVLSYPGVARLISLANLVIVPALAVVTCGVWAFILLPIGLVINSAIHRQGLPPELRSLVFLGAIL